MSPEGSGAAAALGPGSGDEIWPWLSARAPCGTVPARSRTGTLGLSQEPCAPAEVTIPAGSGTAQAWALLCTEHHSLLGAEGEGNGARPGLRAEIPVRAEDIQLENWFSRQQGAG